MGNAELAAFYRGYLDCLNRQDWARLGEFVHEEAQHNGRQIGLSGYRDMLIEDFRQIPDLQFNIEMLVCEGTRVGARLNFDCTPVGDFLGLTVDGQRVKFCENVFYELRDGRIWNVRSVIDKLAIEAQL